MCLVGARNLETCKHISVCRALLKICSSACRRMGDVRDSTKSVDEADRLFHDVALLVVL